MKPNDQFLLEEAYSKILNEMHDIDDIADAVQSGDIHSDENVEISDEHKIYAKYSHFHNKNMALVVKDDMNFGFGFGDSEESAIENAKKDLDYEIHHPHNPNDSEETDELELPYESFRHGIQSISEAKKKVNPWAIEKSIEKKTGKKFGKKHKEEIIKGIKKTAKKSGKKITSDKVKPKNK
jgi:hypothetical protein